MVRQVLQDSNPIPVFGLKLLLLVVEANNELGPLIQQVRVHARTLANA